MKKDALLASVLTQFQIIYLSVPQQTALLDQALRVYQDKAGPFKDVIFAADVSEIATPADLLGIGIALDANGRWHEARIEGSALKVIESAKSVKPYRVYYFINLLTPDIDLPNDSISILFDYVKALITIPNTARERSVALATGIQAEYDSEETLTNRKDLIEQEMDECRGMLPMATVY